MARVPVSIPRPYPSFLRLTAIGFIPFASVPSSSSVFLISGVILTLLVFQDLEILLAELRIGLIENSRFHDESYHFHVCMPILKVTIVIFNEFLFFLRDKFSLKESTFEGNTILNFYTEIMISIVTDNFLDFILRRETNYRNKYRLIKYFFEKCINEVQTCLFK